MNKDIIEVMAEMLIKQDETNRHLVQTNQQLAETNNTLKDFMEVSIHQWNEQHKFNRKLFDKISGFEKIIVLEDRIKHLESLEKRVEKIEKTLKAS